MVAPKQPATDTQAHEVYDNLKALVEQFDKFLTSFTILFAPHPQTLRVVYQIEGRVAAYADPRSEDPQLNVVQWVESYPGTPELLASHYNLYHAYLKLRGSL